MTERARGYPEAERVRDALVDLAKNVVAECAFAEGYQNGPPDDWSIPVTTTARKHADAIVEAVSDALMAEVGFTRDLLNRLRHAPTLSPTDGDSFVISREDLAILLGARTEAADRISALLPPEDPA